MFSRSMCLNRAYLLIVFALTILTSCATSDQNFSVTRTTLSNGLRVVILKSRIAPVTSICVNYLVGSNESPVDFPGTAHAVEHMMFRGSPGLSGDQINTILAGLGGESNAFTSHNVTQYVSTVSSADLKTILQLEAIRMKGALFDEEQWRIERGAINQEVAMYSSENASGLLEIIRSKIFGGTPYARDPLGTANSYNKTTSTMIKQFHETWYAPNNALVVISGNVDPEQTIAMVKTFFGGIPARSIPNREEIRLKSLEASEVNIQSRESYGTAMVVYRLPGIGDRDYAAGQVLAAALASPRGALYELGEKGDVITATFDSFAFPGAAAAYAIAVVPAGQKLRPTASLLKKVIDEYRESGVPPDLVAAIKLRAQNDAETEKNSIPDLAISWSQSLTDGYTSPDEERTAIQKVTATDVNRVARTWLRNDTALTLLIPATKSNASVVPKINFKRSRESFLPKTFKQVALPAWAESVNRLPAKGNRIVPSADMHLENGLRLIVVNTGYGKIISLSGSVKNQPELQTPPGKEGVSGVLEELISRGGSDRMSRQQFQKSLDEIGASAVIGTQFQLSVHEDHFEQGINLLASALLHPALPENEFKILRRQYVELLSSQDKDHEWGTMLAYLKSLYPPDDPEMRHERPQTVSKLTIKDVRDYHAAVMRPDLATLVVTGNITPDKARRIVERSFGAWHANTPKPVIDYPPVPNNKPLSFHVPDPDSDDVSVTLAHTSKLTRTHPDYYPFLVGLNILSASSASRLYQHVREQQGLVYYIGATLDVDRNRSTFRITYGTDAENLAKVRKLVEQDIADMQMKPVSQMELEQAKRLMLRSDAMKGSSFDAIANLLLYFSEQELPLNQLDQAMAQIRLVTPEQVQSTFKKWIRLDGLSQVTRGRRSQG